MKQNSRLSDCEHHYALRFLLLDLLYGREKIEEMIELVQTMVKQKIMTYNDHLNSISSLDVKSEINIKIMSNKRLTECNIFSYPKKKKN